MGHGRRWASDERGSTFEGFALLAAVVAVLSVASADGLNYLSHKHGAAIGASVQHIASVVFPFAEPAGIDYAPTASIPSSRAMIVLDPCTGHVK